MPRQRNCFNVSHIRVQSNWKYTFFFLLAASTELSSAFWMAQQVEPRDPDARSGGRTEFRHQPISTISATERVLPNGFFVIKRARSARVSAIDPARFD